MDNLGELLADLLLADVQADEEEGSWPRFGQQPEEDPELNSYIQTSA